MVILNTKISVIIVQKLVEKLKIVVVKKSLLESFKREAMMRSEILTDL